MKKIYNNIENRKRKTNDDREPKQEGMTNTINLHIAQQPNAEGRKNM